MTCPPAELWADYWLGETPGDELEQHLLGCARCAQTLAEVAKLVEGVRTLARAGLLRVALSDAFLKRLESEGLRKREYRVEAWGSVACTVSPEDHLLVTRLAAELAGVRRVDLAWCDAEGRELGRSEDLPLNPGASEVVLAESIDRVRALPQSVLHFKLLAVEKGGERVLGEYTFRHTPWYIQPP
jgi:hypothetical protein